MKYISEANACERNDSRCKKGPNGCFVRSDGEHCYIKPQLLLYWASALKEKASGVTVRKPPLIPDFEKPISQNRATLIPNPPLQSASTSVTTLPATSPSAIPFVLQPNSHPYPPPHSYLPPNFPFPPYNSYPSSIPSYSYNLPQQPSPYYSPFPHSPFPPTPHNSSNLTPSTPSQAFPLQTSKQIAVCSLDTIAEFLMHAKTVDSRHDFLSFLPAFAESQVLPDILPLISDECLELLCGNNLGATMAIRKLVGRIKI